MKKDSLAIQKDAALMERTTPVKREIVERNIACLLSCTLNYIKYRT